MNEFGGDWTYRKIEILVEYAKAYLVIMNRFAKLYNWQLLYFDGFAGSGLIVKGENGARREILGAARRIIEIESPRAFDSYYFVELSTEKSASLSRQTKDKYPEKKIHIATADCNVKLKDMAYYMASRKKWKALAYIDPFGMQLQWSSLEVVAKNSVDLWVLIPTGVGANRLLTRDFSKITPGWMKRLELFLGMDAESIKNHFYKETTTPTLFGDVTKTEKEAAAVERIAELYASRLGEIFTYVSNRYVLKNSTNSIMFHYLMVSNNKAAVDIANDIISKFNKLN